jgi:flagellar biosynthetic protein FliR
MSDALAVAVVVRFFFVFARVGALLMSMPALGSRVIPAWGRLGAVLPLGFILYPAVAETPIPPSLSTLVAALLAEIAVGVSMGFAVRVVFDVLTMSFEVIAAQIGLSMASLLDPVTGSTPTVLSSLATWLATGIFFGADLHLVCLDAVADSLRAMPPGAVVSPMQAGSVLVPLVEAALRAGVQLAGPLTIFTFVMHLGQSLLGRMAPNLQLFYAIGPVLSVGFGLFVLAAALPALLSTWFALMPRALEAAGILGGLRS